MIINLKLCWRIAAVSGLLLGTAIPVIAQDETPFDETPPSDLRQANPLQIPWRESDAVPGAAELAADAVAPSAVADLGSGSRLLFQSLRDGNWEVYSSNGGGAGQTQLTNHPGSDIYPRLNRGGTRVVFASNRAGNYDLYVMNPDGSGLVQLTANPSDDVAPDWSPDGTQIVFQSYRDGQPEIYRMPAAGGGATRLTNNDGFDGTPAWSPDGTRIAWSAYRDGGYRIWTMNNDGSGATQRSTQPYSFNPT